MSDIIFSTAQRLKIEPRALFQGAYGVIHRPAEGDDRFQRWFKYGEVSPFMVDYCLNSWRFHVVSECETQHPAVSRSGRR